MNNLNITEENSHVYHPYIKDVDEISSEDLLNSISLSIEKNYEI